MAKKQIKESPEKQFERFRQKVANMVDAGELNPTEADERFEGFLNNLKMDPELAKVLKRS